MAEQRIVRDEVHDRPTRSRGPIIGLLVVMALVLVALVVFLVSGNSEDSGDDVELDDIEVDIGEDDG